MSTLRPQLQPIADRHQAIVKACHERLDSLSEAQLRWNHSEKAWSILQIVDHMHRVHNACNPVFMTALLEADFAGDEGTTTQPYTFIDRMFVKMLSPGSKIKLPVPKIFEPHPGRGPAEAVVQKLHDNLEAFEIIIEKADEKKLKGLKVTSPASSALKPSIIAYLDATVHHNRYHLSQIEAILKDPKFPAS